jgi:hypothetical protein
MSAASPASPFPVESLEANRSGRLTDAQRDLWAGVDRRWGGNVSLMALVLGVAGLVLIAGVGQDALAPILRIPAGITCLAGAGILAYVSVLGGGQLSRDLRSGRVEGVEGAIRRDRGPDVYAGDNPQTYYLEVGGTRLRCTQSMYEAAPPAGIVRAYYLPRSRRVVNLERLPDLPLPDGALENPAAALAQAAASSPSHDGVSGAEAMATMQAVRDAVMGEVAAPAAGSAPAATTGSARPLAEEIVGTWRNPLLTATIAPDGTASATMLDGKTLTGRWSIANDGTLRLHGLGGDMTGEATVSGDTLTLLMDGQGVSLRRVARG